MDYDPVPPVGGPHAPVWLDCGVYDEQVREEVKRLGKTVATLVFGDGGQQRGVTEASAGDVAVAEADDVRPVDETASAPSWDVFSSRRKSSVLVFQNSQMEQSE